MSDESAQTEIKFEQTKLICFKFLPLQYVKVMLFDLKYPGRVMDCIYDNGHQNKYRVQYSDDKGDLKHDTFYDDELEAA